jgi:hypothetical protein
MKPKPKKQVVDSAVLVERDGKVIINTDANGEDADGASKPVAA